MNIIWVHLNVLKKDIFNIVVLEILIELYFSLFLTFYVSNHQIINNENNQKLQL